MKPERLGVSVVICCHNSAERLPATLEHLRLQVVPERIQWEVLVIDNASTDATAQVAHKCWPAGSPAALRVIHEPRLGLSNARERGFNEARYEIVSFVDDDNWINNDWVKVASEVMTADPELGAVGGVSEPLASVPLPPWFERYANFYAILREHEFDTLGTPPTRLIGAGLTVRKAAWDRLLREGFHSWLPDRQGARLSGGGDTELTIALRLNGWKLGLEPRLRLKHFMPEHRLNWRYLRRMVRTYAVSHVALNAYYINNDTDHLRLSLRRKWWWHVLSLTKGLMLSPEKIIAFLRSSNEGNREAIEAEEILGRIIGSATLRGRYQKIERDVRNARWRLRSEQ